MRVEYAAIVHPVKGKNALPEDHMDIRTCRRSELRIRMTRLLLFAGLFGAVLASAGCKDSKTDVTNNTSYGDFSSVVGTWKSKVPLYLFEIDKKLYVDTRSALFGNGRKLATLPVGTEVRIEHLIQEKTFETTLLYPTGSLTSGPYANRTVEIDPTLFVPNRFLRFQVDTTTQPSVGKTSKWAVVPDILGK